MEMKKGRLLKSSLATHIKKLTCVWLKMLNLALVGRQPNDSFSLFCVSFSFVLVVLVFCFVIDSCTYVFL